MRTLENRAGLRIELMENGAIRAIRHGRILINQILGSPLEPAIGNVYLRHHPARSGSGEVGWWPLTGPAAGWFGTGSSFARWISDRAGMETRVDLRLDPLSTVFSWYVRVTNRSDRPRVVDVVLSQDLGLADEAAVRASELYTSQYIDHAVLRDPSLGYVLCSRQNLSQDSAHPWIVQGCLSGSTAYLTDGFQFHGLGYRATNVPVALGSRRLPSSVYQYELALPTLQSRSLRLAPGRAGEFVFMAYYEPDHPAATGPDDLLRFRSASVTHLQRVAAEAEELAEGAEADAAAEAEAEAAEVGPAEVEVDDAEAAAADKATVAPVALVRPLRSVLSAPRLFPSADLDDDDLDRHFGPDRRNTEEAEGLISSFFFADGRHAVLRRKELETERPAGHIVQSGSGLVPDDDILSATAWMDGVFASQLAIGNTSFNQLIGVWRNPLNVLKSGGLRVLVGPERLLLALPSSFDMGAADARWIYHDRLGDRTIIVRVEASRDEPALRLDVDIERGGPLALVLMHDVVLGGDDGRTTPRIRMVPGRALVEFTADPASPIGRHYPDAAFFLVSPDIDAIEEIGDDRLLALDDRDAARRPALGSTAIVLRTHPVEHFSLAFTGSLLDPDEGGRRAERLGAPAAGRGDSAGWRGTAGLWRRAGRDLALRLRPSGAPATASRGPAAEAAHESEDKAAREVARLGEVLGWFAQNALVHLLTPHGLEQSAGAAWGVRDVCQGPVEFLIAIGQYEPVRHIIRTVYAHQYEGTGDWPQWFMFDRYREIQAVESHGDVVHWPLKALCDYIEATGDLAILDEHVEYTDERSLKPSRRSDTILAHTERQLDRIEATCIPGTTLVAFGHGDWEDTLQPADEAMAARLVSPWTVELAYQTLGRYRAVCERAGRGQLTERLASLCERIRTDFNRELVPDGIVAGLAHFGPNGTEYLLHPRDRATGVTYRLLPMTRGLISGMFTPDQARRHMALIDSHLRFPDGVHLMDRPIEYRGGVERMFRRAESAANFGRENGLQYVHAHLRFAEAMARVGRADDALWGLLAVCPVGLGETVPSALPRQSNAYFSSSDGAFTDRYEARRRFGELRQGRLGVKGGWRVYSSGPGLFIHQLVSNILGVRGWFGDVLIDPVLPTRLDGIELESAFEGRPVRYRYRVRGAGFGPSSVSVNGRAMSLRRAENPYRPGGVLVDRRSFADALEAHDNVVDIDV